MLTGISIDSNKMEQLPTEVVCEILGHSDLKEIKLIRMAFARSPHGAKWIESGANLLFKQIYFSLGPQAMLRFRKITETKHLQEIVRHLVFVNSQLDERLVDSRALFLSTLPEADSMSRAQVNKTYETYCRTFREWQTILDDGEDVALLTKGLHLLPNLNKVSIIGGPSHDPGTTSYLENGPYAADVHGVGVTSSYWSYRSKTAPEYHQFDRRPIQNLLRCLCAGRVRPTKVELGNWRKYSNGKVTRMGVPISCLNLYCGLGNAMFDTVVTTAFGNVTDLSLQLDMNPRPYDPDAEYKEEDLSLLFRVLPALQGLQRLTVKFIHWGLVESETKRLLEGNTWMALEFLSLRSFEISPATFTVFVQNHRNTLKELSLARVGLPSGCQETWSDVISRNKTFLNLRGARFQVYEWETADDGSEECIWLDDDQLLNLLFGNEEDKDESENEGRNEEDETKERENATEDANEDQTMQED